MSTGLKVRKALILSPVASHPQDYGNRNRVLHTTSFFKDLGFEIHYLLYPFEPDWLQGIPESAKEMRDTWTSFSIIPPSRPLHQPALAEHHTIDEWWDPQIGHYLDWLFARTSFDVFLVNYTFLAKAFEHATRGTVKILETHDLFSGRREMFAANGAGPDFFYTTPDQEKIAFDRADIVIAIKDGEAAILRRMTRRDVVSLPFYIPSREPKARPERLLAASELRVGFLGALNTVNVLNMQRFLERFEKFQQIYVPNLRLDVVGNVCSRLSTKSPSVNLVGRVEEIDEFYDNVDVVVAPLMFSTGIKIKVGEALSYGKAVVATKNGFDGYTPMDPFHSLENFDAVARALMTLAFDRERLKLLEKRTAVTAQLAARHTADGYRALAHAVKRHSKIIAFITDQPVWSATTVRQERAAQWCQLCGHICRSVVIAIGPNPVELDKRNDLNFVQFVDLSAEAADPRVTTDSVMTTLAELSQSHEIIEVVISVGGALGDDLWNNIRQAYANITLDTWIPSLARIAGNELEASTSDLWLSQEDAEEDAQPGRFLSATTFRYEPFYLRGWSRRPRTDDVAIVLCTPDANDLNGVDLLTTAANGSRHISTIDIGMQGGGDGMDFSLEPLKDHPLPSLFVAVGNDLRAVNAVRNLAGQAGIECLHAGSASFPFVLNDEDGASHLCRTYSDLAAHLADPTFTASRGSLQAADAGWSTYWRLVARR